MVTRKKRRTAAVPEQPSGTLAIQMPPEKAEPASIGNVLMMVVPMLGSTGVMVFMAMQNPDNTRSMLMGGGMLVAMPTAMPEAPLTRRLGKAAGRTPGSVRV